MKKNIKISAVNSSNIKMWEEANPFSRKFDYSECQVYLESNIQKMLGLLEEAGRKKTDLVCTSEDFIGYGQYLYYMGDDLFPSIAEKFPEPVSEKFSSVAKKYNMYIAANYYEKDADKIFNTTVLIGRDGNVIGKYRKVHLPVNEKWQVKGGTEFPVFETDIGNIGISTCYDIIFPEHCRILALNGADIIIHPTQGWGINKPDIGEALVRVRAAENAVYLVAVKNTLYSTGRSCIINNYGDIIAEAKGKEDCIVTAEISSDYDMVREDLFPTFFSGVSSVRARLALEREPSLYKVITDESPPLLNRYKGMKLATEDVEIKRRAIQWKEHVAASFENKPSPLKYIW